MPIPSSILLEENLDAVFSYPILICRDGMSFASVSFEVSIDGIGY